MKGIILEIYNNTKNKILLIIDMIKEVKKPN